MCSKNLIFCLLLGGTFFLAIHGAQADHQHPPYYAPNFPPGIQPSSMYPHIHYWFNRVYNFRAFVNRHHYGPPPLEQYVPGPQVEIIDAGTMITSPEPLPPPEVIPAPEPVPIPTPAPKGKTKIHFPSR